MIIDDTKPIPNTPVPAGDRSDLFAQLPPRLAFFAGVTISSGIIFAIGCIALIILLFKGN